MIKKMKNIEMVTAVNGLQAFIDKEKELPVSVSVAISANMKNLLRELEPYEEARVKIMKKKAGRDKEFKELLALEADVSIRMIELNTLLGFEMSTKDFMALEFMLVETEDDIS